jgi:RNA polymerase sigma factor (sigma-70 family)
MPARSDIDLLREYVSSGSESAFAQVVHRHVNLVYSVALRYTCNGEDAQDVAQAVFVLLAGKAASLRPKTIVTGWLYETTRFTAMNFLTNKSRRQAREQEAYMQSTLNDAETETIWRQLAPLLEGAMSRLSEGERTLVALRFFENRSMGEVAGLLGINEWAARKRVERVMEKMRACFSKHGVNSAAATIAGAISANSVQAAPTTLAKTATAVALAKGATASISTSTAIQGALKIMAWTKTKTAIVTVVAVALAAGTGLETLAMIKRHRLQQEAARPIIVPGRAWSNAGQHDPKSTLTTFLWAASQNDGTTILNSFSPEGQQHWQGMFGKRMQQERKSLEQILAQEVPDHFSQVLNEGFTILDHYTNAAGQMLLHLRVPGDPKLRAFWFRNIGGEWKIDDFE